MCIINETLEFSRVSGVLHKIDMDIKFKRFIMYSLASSTDSLRVVNTGYNFFKQCIFIFRIIGVLVRFQYRLKMRHKI